MSSTVDPTAEKALAINLDPSLYGTFAEIGAGQEVARWFFSVGGAAGTVAKTISAYDMTVSDFIYGKAPRYVSRERIDEMLDHEYRLLHERLDETRGTNTRFFALADTASALSHAGCNECHAWMGIRFQHMPRSAHSDVIVHVRLLDATNVLQQEALGRLGVNLLHAACHAWSTPKQLIERLLDDVGRGRLEIDWIVFRGAAFPAIDNRIMALHLVKIGFTPAVLFDSNGQTLLASEAIRKKCVLLERGRFAPVTTLNLQMIDKARQLFDSQTEGLTAASKHAENTNETLEIMEITMNNMRDRGQVVDQEFLCRIDLLVAVGKMVLVSDLGPFYRLAEYLAARQVDRTGIVLGVPLLREIFNESHYSDLAGGILEAFGRLFTSTVRLYVHPTRDAITGHMITSDTLAVAPHLSHLLHHVLANGFIFSIPCEESTLCTYSSEEVRSRICSGDPSWKTLVDPVVAAIIAKEGFFGAHCETRH